MVYLKIKNVETYFNTTPTCIIVLSSNKNDYSFTQLCGFAFTACGSAIWFMKITYLFKCVNIMFISSNMTDRTKYFSDWHAGVSLKFHSFGFCFVYRFVVLQFIFFK